MRSSFPWICVQMPNVIMAKHNYNDVCMRICEHVLACSYMSMYVPVSCIHVLDNLIDLIKQ